MLRDIYIRNSDDPKFELFKLEETDRTQELIAQIKLMFATKKGEVISHPDFGIALDEYLFEFYLDEDKLKADLSYQYSEYIGPYFKDFSVEFDVTTEDSGIQQLAIIDIYINGNQKLQLII